MPAPTNKVYILALDSAVSNSYQHTYYWFADAGEQSNFFLSKAKFPMEDCTYTRETQRIRINRNAEELMTCNYLMWQNTDLSDKWYYAFITGIEFKSEETSWVYFELDVLQTWYFDYTWLPSLVDREHVSDDTIGANTLPEGLPVSEYVVSQVSKETLEGLNIIVGSTVDENGEDARGGVYNGIYSGCYYQAFSQQDYSGVNAFIQNLAEKGKADAIVGISVVPQWLTGGPGTVANSNIPVVETITGPGRPASLDGYVPKNNKLFTYPFCALSVFAGSGGSAVFHYELFNTPNAPTFTMRGVLSLAPEISIRPTYYAGTSTPDQNVSLSGFPACSWNNDVFANWYGQNKVSTFFNLGTGLISGLFSNISNGVSGLSNFFSGNVGGLAQNAVAGITTPLNTLLGGIGQGIDLYTRSITPPQLSGNASAASLLTASSDNCFYLQSKTIRAEYARMIDDYFTAYGYHVSRLKIPNVNTRQSWNFVRTAQANISGSIPFNDLTQIKKIFNNGITLWHGDYIGDYSKANGVVTSGT